MIDITDEKDGEITTLTAENLDLHNDSIDVDPISEAEIGKVDSTEVDEEGKGNGTLINDSLLLLVDKMSCVETNTEQIRSEIDKVLDGTSKLMGLYDTMTDCRNRFELLLTKVISVYEKVYSLKNFCEAECLSSEIKETSSLLKRVAALERSLKINLGTFGVVPIAPVKNDEYNSEEHCIVGTQAIEDEGDLNDAIAECCRLGYVRDGRVTSAEVIVFTSEKNNNPEKGE
jgi:hypothetical protein